MRFAIALVGIALAALTVEAEAQCWERPDGTQSFYDCMPGQKGVMRVLTPDEQLSMIESDILEQIKRVMIYQQKFHDLREHMRARHDELQWNGQMTDHWLGLYEVVVQASHEADNMLIQTQVRLAQFRSPQALQQATQVIDMMVGIYNMLMDIDWREVIPPKDEKDATPRSTPTRQVA